MKPSKLETLLSLAGSLFILLVVFHKPIGLSDDWEWLFLIAMGACLIALFIVQRRQRNVQVASVSQPVPSPFRRKRFWLLLVLIIAGSLSGPLWLPYTGVGLPISTVIVTSTISCIVAVGVLLFAWR